MKTLIFIFMISIVSYSLSFSQNKTQEKELSNAEKFSQMSGTLIQKEFITIGKVRDIEVQVIFYTDVINNVKRSGLRFEFILMKSYGDDSKVAILDPDEVDGLIKSVKIMLDRFLSSTCDNYTEISFYSRGGFEAGCYGDNNKWRTFLKLEKYDSDSYKFLNTQDFEQLLDILEKSKTYLSQ